MNERYNDLVESCREITERADVYDVEETFQKFLDQARIHDEAEIEHMKERIRWLKREQMDAVLAAQRLCVTIFIDNRYKRSLAAEAIIRYISQVAFRRRNVPTRCP